MARTTVAHYGIHQAKGGVAFLEQARGGANAVGLKEKSPFVVRTPKNQQCNHLIPLNAPNPDRTHLDFIENLKEDPLFQAMMPVPKSRMSVAYVADPDDRLGSHLQLLSKMSSPITNVVVPIWMLTINQIVDSLQATNVQPLVLTSIEPQHTDLVNKAAKAAAYAPRMLVMTGTKDIPLPPNVVRLQTKLGQHDLNELMVLPWEAIGAVITRKYMRGEWDTEANWMTSRPVPYSEKKPYRPHPKSQT